MAQTIQIKRRIPGTGKPPSGTGANQVTAGELATSISVTGAAGIANLYIGDGTYVHDLVSNQRQLELDGPQTIIGAKIIGAAGSLTSPLANFHIQGGTNGYLLSTNGSGTLSWIAPPSAVIVSATEPTTGMVAGDLWFDTADETLNLYDGTAWVPATDLSGYLPLTGGTLTGNLTLGGTNSLTVGGTITVNGAAGITTSQVQSTGNLTLTVPAASNILLPHAPTVDLGAATKKYVDDAAAAGFTGVNVAAPITGNGMPGATNALEVTMATTAQINTGTDDVYPIDSEGLRTQTGAAVSTLKTSTKTIVPAINELYDDLGDLESQLAAVTGALRFVGNYNAAASQVATAATGTLTVGANLPAAIAPPTANANEGWYVIVTVAGTPTAPAPTVPMQVGDWIVSTGTQWIHVPLYHVAVTAANVGITTINSQTWTNVQQALVGIYTLLTTAGTAAVVADDVSIVGDGTTADPLTAALLDGGSY